MLVCVWVGWVKEDACGHKLAPTCFMARGAHDDVGTVAKVRFGPVITIGGVGDAEQVLGWVVFDTNKIIQAQTISFWIGQDGDRDEHVAQFVRLVGYKDGFVVFGNHAWVRLG